MVVWKVNFKAGKHCVLENFVILNYSQKLLRIVLDLIYNSSIILGFPYEYWKCSAASDKSDTAVC